METLQDSQDQSIAPLEYEAPKSKHEMSQGEALAALLLAVPGASAWSIFLLMIFGPRVMSVATLRAIGDVVGDLFFPLVFLAMATAAISIVWWISRIFRKKPRNWAMRLNLTINIPGLLFALLAFIPLLFRW